MPFEHRFMKTCEISSNSILKVLFALFTSGIQASALGLKGADSWFSWFPIT